MDVRELLVRLRAGEITVDQAAEHLTVAPLRDLGVATVDAHRELRQGVPEVIFGEGKTAAQIVGVARALVESSQNVLVTRIGAELADRVRQELPAQLIDSEGKPCVFTYDPTSRLGRIQVRPVTVRTDVEPVVVVTGGTSDVPIAEEAAQTLEVLGLPTQRMYDVGVAGIHRLLHRTQDLRRASAVIAIAGMEGALPSVIGGIVACPVVAVPTSVGYGTALGGFTALFAMLTSCASGVTVVNIDNGFGAALAVHRILKKRPVSPEPAP